jgi:DNA-binding NarL/FixJ family response regulator
MSSNSASLVRRRILIVDDHPVVRQGLVQAMSREPDLEILGETDRIEEALRLVESGQPDVVIIDLSLDGEDGIELIDYIKSRWSSVKILVYSSHDEEVYAGRVLRAGAMGYVSKREPMPTTVTAVRQILRGDVYLSPRMTTNFLQRAAIGKPLEQDPVQTLSNRELQVFRMMGQGMNTVQIAHKLDLSPKTIESHRKVIKTKLNVQTVAELSRRAFQWMQENTS